MSTQKRKAFRAVAVFLAFAVAQVYVQFSFAAPNASESTVLLPQQLVAVLTSTGGSAVVNGNSASSGATILSGAEVEAPAGVQVSINLGRLGKVDLDPGSKIRLYYECSENAHATAVETCRVRAVVLAGCVHIAASKGTRGQIDTETEENAKKDEAGGGTISHCVSPVSGVQTSTTGAGGGGGLSTGAKIAILTAAVFTPIGIWWAIHGGNENVNPSPGTP
jgi:hypothetical protein